MADINWSPSSDLSSFYMGRMAPPIKLPDGTYIPAPNTMPVAEMYRGIYPPALPTPPSTPLIARSVNTVPIDPMTGNPIGKIGNNIPSTRETMAEQRSGWRPAVTEGVQPAGTATMPPGARPSNIPLPSMSPPPTQSAGVWDPFNTINPNADQSRLPTDLGYMTGPPPEQNSALNAIDLLTGSGRSTGSPFPLPAFRQPTYAPPAEIAVNGGTQMGRQAPIPLTPSPLLRGQPPSVPSRGGALGAITFKRGDTVSKLARERGMTVKSFADIYGIANPDKIRAGDTVIPSVPMPRMRPPALRGGSKTVSGSGPNVLDEVGALRYHG